MKTKKKLNTWLEQWLKESEIPTRLALAEELELSSSAISHWCGKMNRIPEERLRQMDALWPVNFETYHRVLEIPYDPWYWYGDDL